MGVRLGLCYYRKDINGDSAREEGAEEDIFVCEERSNRGMEIITCWGAS